MHDRNTRLFKPNSSIGPEPFSSRLPANVRFNAKSIQALELIKRIDYDLEFEKQHSGVRVLVKKGQWVDGCTSERPKGWQKWLVMESDCV